jgi:hypothetical protein
VTLGHCLETTPSGCPCHHLASRCPFHVTLEPEAPPEAVAERPDPHRYIHNALQTVIEGKSSPSVIARLVRTLEIANRLGPPPFDAERIADEIVLKGMTMHGFAPTTEAQWALAREMFTPGALHMFATWLAPWDPRPPEWLKDIPNPETDLFHTFPQAVRPWDVVGSDNHLVNPNNPEETCDPIVLNSRWRPTPVPSERAEPFDPEEPPLWGD